MIGMRRTFSYGAAALDELKEFAGFDQRTQRYIRQSLDVARGRVEAALGRARDDAEAAEISGQASNYARLDELRAALAENDEAGSVTRFMALLTVLTAGDLARGRLDGFAAYRFLYERLLGAAARPWLLSSFCAAAALPLVHPHERARLLASVTASAVSAPGWSNREPQFHPEWLDETDLPIPSPG
jgi:hypothetical protein